MSYKVMTFLGRIIVWNEGWLRFFSYICRIKPKIKYNHDEEILVITCSVDGDYCNGRHAVVDAFCEHFA